MKTPVLLKYVLPFFQWYALMIFLTLVIDYFLHRFNLIFVGRYFGLIGTLVIIISLPNLRKSKSLDNPIY